MNGLILVLIGAGLLALGFAVVRLLQYRGDARRRREASEACDKVRKARRDREKEAEAEHLVFQAFPFIREPVLERVKRGERLLPAARTALRQYPGTLVGVTKEGRLPVTIPTALRRTHQVAFGRTGAGKTTLGLHLLVDDLKKGRGVVVIGVEKELFRDHILPRIPVNRDVVYYAPGDAACPITWNPFVVEPGHDRSRASLELFAILRRAFATNSLGPRSDAIARNTFSALVGYFSATFLSVRPLLEDEAFRLDVIANNPDPECRAFFTETYPRMPKNSSLPLVGRVTSFTTANLRRTLCNPVSSLSLSEALDQQKVVLIDLSGLDPDATSLLGQMFLSAMQLELMKRERMPESERPLTLLFADEFHEFQGSSRTWRQLTSKGRRYGIGVAAYTQHPGQLTHEIRDELLSNCGVISCLAVQAKDAARLKRELLVVGPDGKREPVDATKLIGLKTGEACMRIGNDATAVFVKINPPLAAVPMELGQSVREKSWKRYAAPPLPEPGTTPVTHAESQQIIRVVRTQGGSERETGSPTPSPGPRTPRTGETAITGSPCAAGMSDKSTEEEAVENPPQPVARTATSPGVRPGAPSPEGRGGPDHKYLQALLKRMAQSRNYLATIEKKIRGGIADVVLEKDEVKIAVEVSVTSSPRQELKHVRNCLAANFDHILVVAQNQRSLGKIAKLVEAELDDGERRRVRCLTPDVVPEFLDGLDAPNAASESTVAGYKVKVAYRATDNDQVKVRQKAISEVIASTLRRNKG